MVDKNPVRQHQSHATNTAEHYLYNGLLKPLKYQNKTGKVLADFNGDVDYYFERLKKSNVRLCRINFATLAKQYIKSKSYL